MDLENGVVALRTRRPASVAVVDNPEAHVSAQDVLAQEETDELDARREQTCEDVRRALQRGIERSEIDTERMWGIPEVQIAEKDPQVAQRG